MNREFPHMALAEAIDSIDLGEAARIRDDYEGRASYGRKSFGVVVPSMRDALRLAVALGVVCGERASTYDDDAELADLANEMMQNVYCDSMGHDVILYFDGWRLAN